MKFKENDRFYDLVGWGGAIAAGESGARGDGGGDGGGKDSGGGDSRGDGTGGYEDGGDGSGDGTGGLPFKHYGGHDAGPSGGSGDPPVVSVVPPRVPWDEAPGAPGGGDGGHFGAADATESDFSEEESGSEEEGAPAGVGAASDDDAIEISSDDQEERSDGGSGVVQQFVPDAEAVGGGDGDGGKRKSSRNIQQTNFFVNDVKAHRKDKEIYAEDRASGGASSGGASKRPRPAMAPGGGASQRPRPAPAPGGAASKKQVVPAVVVPQRPESAATRPVRNPNPNFRFDFNREGRSDTDRREDLKTKKGS